MAVGRITQNILSDRALNDIQDQLGRILDLQIQLSTGQKVNRPSDDPLAALRAVRARNEINKTEQFLTNLGSATPFLRDTEAALQTSLDTLQRAYELALQGASDTNAQTQLDQIAVEINQLLEGLLRQGNATSGDRFIFSGTRTNTPAYSATRNGAGEITAIAYDGNSERIGIQIDEQNNVAINVTGQEAFDVTFAGTVDIFQSLIDLRDNLRAGDKNGLQTRIDELQRGQDQLLFALARIGALDNRFEREVESQETAQQSQRVNLSNNLDADYAEVVLQLEARQNAFSAALNAAARVIQPSLLDFLR